MEYKKHFIIKQDIIHSEEGEILTEVDSSDIIIVTFNDGFFDVEKPIYAVELEDYHTPLALLKRRPDGMYERFEIKKRA